MYLQNRLTANSQDTKLPQRPFGPYFVQNNLGRCKFSSGGFGMQILRVSALLHVPPSMLHTLSAGNPFIEARFLSDLSCMLRSCNARDSHNGMWNTRPAAVKQCGPIYWGSNCPLQVWARRPSGMQQLRSGVLKCLSTACRPKQQPESAIPTAKLYASLAENVDSRVPQHLFRS
jgi:hypothetical protein